jgi:RecA/RadA recombinase
MSELTTIQETVLRIVGIGDLLGIEGGLSKQQITDIYKLLEPVLKPEVIQ